MADARQCLEVAEAQHASYLQIVGLLMHMFESTLDHNCPGRVPGWLEKKSGGLGNLTNNCHLFDNFLSPPSILRESGQKVGSTKLALKALFEACLDYYLKLLFWRYKKKQFRDEFLYKNISPCSLQAPFEFVSQPREAFAPTGSYKSAEHTSAQLGNQERYINMYMSPSQPSQAKYVCKQHVLWRYQCKSALLDLNQ